MEYVVVFYFGYLCILDLHGPLDVYSLVVLLPTVLLTVVFPNSIYAKQPYSYVAFPLWPLWLWTDTKAMLYLYGVMASSLADINIL